MKQKKPKMIEEILDPLIEHCSFHQIVVLRLAIGFAPFRSKHVRAYVSKLVGFKTSQSWEKILRRSVCRGCGVKTRAIHFVCARCEPIFYVDRNAIRSTYKGTRSLERIIRELPIAKRRSSGAHLFVREVVVARFAKLDS